MAMAHNFRSALNGFNREDVVHYIEYLNAKHNSELQQLTAELELLRSQSAAPDLSRQLQQAQEEIEALRAQLAEKPAADPQAEEEILSLQIRCEELELQLQEAVDARQQAEAARDTAAATVSHSMEQELEAYRRAERTEREARERAQQTVADATRRSEEIRRRANGALADATVRVEESFSQINQLAAGVNDQLAQLQVAVAAGRQVLSDASQALYTIGES